MPHELELERVHEQLPSSEGLEEGHQAFRLEEGDIETDRRREELANLAQDREQREKYAARLFCLICVWIAFVLIIVFLHGCELVPFRLTQTELVTLIGSTTINVLGLFAIVARYLFPKR